MRPFFSRGVLRVAVAAVRRSLRPFRDLRSNAAAKVLETSNLVDPTRGCIIVQDLDPIPLSETAEALRCVHQRLAVLLHLNSSTSARVRLSGLALELNSWPT